MSINESNRSSQLAASEAARESRQKLYREFLSSLNRYEGALSEVSAVMLEPTLAPETQTAKLAELGKSQILFADALNTVWMTGSEDMFVIADRYVVRLNRFARDDMAPFTDRYTPKGSYSEYGEDEWRKSTSALGAAAHTLIEDLEAITGDFLKQARKDLT
ncbi:hypothetical protein [Nocardia gipuzkoensis]|uniref:hypothetical protein n=1 Tax=Nocardia gipuzkoensis TaxID=2749991 RepID=UPI00237E1A07|nr:hypothetical protein [Nocardia gipuzkoensis]MDE1675002.1 hypothetical protein [Nocardia gipuzkoensis]